MSDVVFAYTTLSTKGAAKSLSRHLLEKRLIACANIIENMTSVYEWQGQIEEAQECVVILKTQTSFKEKLEQEVLSAHPYECPCLVFLSLSDANKAFASWITSQTGEIP